LKKLVAYLTSGYPDTQFTIDLALSLKEVGVDSLELGIPFSDPVADGNVIEKANLLALKHGVKFNHIKTITKAISTQIDTLWMGYYNSFYKQGFDKLTKEAKELNVSGFIIPDLPYEEALIHSDIMNKHNINNISFIAPTDSLDRIKNILKDSKKFIYLVAYTGITGSGKEENLDPIIEDIRSVTNTPIYVGFGVNQNTAKEKVKNVDGVIVGSDFVKELLNDSLSHTKKIQIITEKARVIKEIINL